MNPILRNFIQLTDALAIALGLMCLAAGLAAQGGRFNVRLDILTHFAPIWLAGSVLTLIYGLARSQNASQGVLISISTFAVFAAIALMAPEYLRKVEPWAPVDAPNQIKIVQLNAWILNRDVAATARWIASQNPDVITINEITPTLQKAIEHQTGYHYRRGIVGSGIFTRAEPLGAGFMLGDPWNEWPDLARARVPVGNGSAVVIAVHLTWPTDLWQIKQRVGLAKIMKRTDPSHLIMIGDFNLTPWSFTLQGLDKSLGLTRRDRAIFSWPAQPVQSWHGKVAFLPIDHVYAGSAWRTVDIKRGPRLGSDHYPIVVTLALTD